MTYWWKSKDPEAGIESSKYENPAPSRTFILSYIKETGTPLTFVELRKAFKLKMQDVKDALKRRLRAMCRDGQLSQNHKNAFYIPAKIALVSGKVQGHREKFGFMIPDDGSPDFFLTPKQMATLFHGDLIQVKEIYTDAKQRRWCKIEKVLERAFTEIAGVYSKRNGKAYITPDSVCFQNDILVTSGKKPKEGDIVVAKITKYPEKKQNPTSIITSILGSSHNPKVEIDLSIQNYHIPHTWSKELKAYTLKLPSSIPKSVIKNRIDLRQLPLLTIDGEDAKDFDDAIYATTKKSGGWRLYVAIADVSHYVKPNTILDTEAQNRGTSVYFPEKVVPMLPEKLSNGLCSLVPQKDRLALVCEMTISTRGKLSGYKFYEAIINSHARLTYTEAGKMLGLNPNRIDNKLRNKYLHLVEHLETLHNLYLELKKVRIKRGAIDFDTTETFMVFDKQGQIKEIKPIIRHDAHKMIEECMLCANESAAKLLKKSGLFTLFRTHKGPTEKKLQSLYAFLGERGLHFLKNESPTPEQYQTLINKIQNRPDAEMIQNMLLRSLSQAEYNIENDGHFGLAYESYTHFTSPIRRYPDLVVHRAIRSIIYSNKHQRHTRFVDGSSCAKSHQYNYNIEVMEKLGADCSYKERRAEEASRDAVTGIKCHYISKRIGESFIGKIISVMNFGVFVELDACYVSGLVHISSLPEDLYHFEKAKQCLVGKHSRKTFKIGQIINVTVTNVHIEQKRIDLVLTKNENIKGQKKTKKTSNKKSGVKKKKNKQKNIIKSMYSSFKIKTHYC